MSRSCLPGGAQPGVWVPLGMLRHLCQNFALENTGGAQCGWGMALVMQRTVHMLGAFFTKKKSIDFGSAPQRGTDYCSCSVPRGRACMWHDAPAKPPTEPLSNMLQHHPSTTPQPPATGWGPVPRGPFGWSVRSPSPEL